MDIELLLESGLSGVICSSMAVKSPQEWQRAVREHPDKMILGLDLKNGKMAYGGWLVTSDKPIEEFLNPMIQLGLKTVLSTDISRDGMLSGPNVEMYRDLQARFPALNWIASGGVSGMQDLENLAQNDLYGVVVGKAYYENRVTLAEIDRKSTRLNSSHVAISYAVFCLKKKTDTIQPIAAGSECEDLTRQARSVRQPRSIAVDVACAHSYTVSVGPCPGLAGTESRLVP